MGVRLGRVSILNFVSRNEVVLVTLVSLLEMNKRVGYVLKCLWSASRAAMLSAEGDGKCSTLLNTQKLN